MRVLLLCMCCLIVGGRAERGLLLPLLRYTIHAGWRMAALLRCWPLLLHQLRY